MHSVWLYNTVNVHITTELYTLKHLKQLKCIFYVLRILLLFSKKRARLRGEKKSLQEERYDSGTLEGREENIDKRI